MIIDSGNQSERIEKDEIRRDELKSVHEGAEQKNEQIKVEIPQ